MTRDTKKRIEKIAGGLRQMDNRTRNLPPDLQWVRSAFESALDQINMMVAGISHQIEEPLEGKGI